MKKVVELRIRRMMACSRVMPISLIGWKTAERVLNPITGDLICSSNVRLTTQDVLTFQKAGIERILVFVDMDCWDYIPSARQEYRKYKKEMTLHCYTFAVDRDKAERIISNRIRQCEFRKINRK